MASDRHAPQYHAAQCGYSQPDVTWRGLTHRSVAQHGDFPGFWLRHDLISGIQTGGQSIRAPASSLAEAAWTHCIINERSTPIGYAHAQRWVFIVNVRSDLLRKDAPLTAVVETLFHSTTQIEGRMYSTNRRAEYSRVGGSCSVNSGSSAQSAAADWLQLVSGSVIS